MPCGSGINIVQGNFYEYSNFQYCQLVLNTQFVFY